MRLKLDPGSGEEIEKRHLLHRIAARKQAAAHFAGIRGEQPRAGLGANGVVCDVAREARARRPFHGILKIIPSPIGCAAAFNAGRRLLAFRLKANQRPLRVDVAQVVAVELLAHVGQR